VLGIALAVCLAWPDRARADPTGAPAEDPAGAHALFAEARDLVAKGEIARACSKFEESYRLRAGIGTLFNLADCWERLGRSASAWAGFLDVAARAKRASETEREQVARERASALVPKLARLTIKVAPGERLPRIERNNVVVGPAMLDSPVPVDPGVHQINASAPGKLLWQRALTVEPGSQLVLEVPPLKDAPAAPRPAKRSAAHERPIVTREQSSPPLAQRTMGYVLGGVGIAAVGAGTFFGFRAMAKNDDALAKCPNSICATEEERAEHGRLVDDAHMNRALAYTSLALGVGALAGTTVLIVTTPREQRVLVAARW